MRTSRTTTRRACCVLVLAAGLALAASMPAATPASAVGGPVIDGSTYNITNFVEPNGHESWGFSAQFCATGDWADGPGVDDVAVTIGGEAYPVDWVEAFEATCEDDDDSDVDWAGFAYGPFDEEPPLDVLYQITVSDLHGSDTFDVGYLQDFPVGGPEILTGSGQVGATPTFSWGAFDTDYDGELRAPWAYELNLEIVESGFYTVFPIDHDPEADVYTILYDDSRWMNEDGEFEAPPPLSPGVHRGTLHSNHWVAEGFAFEHHVTFELFVNAGGFVTGGGWFESPDGAYVPDPTLTGTANFAFNVKLHQGQPKGSMEFQAQYADLNFHSTEFHWLLTSVEPDGAGAQFAGTGTINGEGEYRFFANVLDGQTDWLHMSIWVDGGDLVYDNYIFTDDYEGGTPLAGGNIVAHFKGGTT